MCCPASNGMKTKILLPAMLLAVIAALVIAGYLKATPPPDNQTQDGPKIEISPASFDFGQIEFGKIVETKFTVKNNGNQLLEIKRVATSCGCTTAKISKEKIDPGESAVLLVVYDTAAMGSGPHGKGKQDRIIYIRSNDPANAQIETTITAYVE